MLFIFVYTYICGSLHPTAIYLIYQIKRSEMWPIYCDTHHKRDPRRKQHQIPSWIWYLDSKATLVQCKHKLKPACVSRYPTICSHRLKAHLPLNTPPPPPAWPQCLQRAVVLQLYKRFTFYWVVCSYQTQRLTSVSINIRIHKLTL